MEALIKRQKDLNREANVASIEAGCIALQISETKTFKVLDIQAWSRIRTRLHRLKPDFSFETELYGNSLTVKRIG